MCIRDRLYTEAEGAIVSKALAQLPDRVREVVRLRYGVDGEDPTPLKETGRRLGISAERVRQLEQDALEQLARDGELATLREAA